MQIWPVRLLVVQAIAGVALGGAVALTLAIIVSAYAALVGAPLAAWLYWRLATRRYRRRRRVTAGALPALWRALLEQRLPYYRGLDEAERARFDNDVRIFLYEQRIYGIRGVEVDDETRVLIAAAAAMLSNGLVDWEWPNVRDVVVYPRAFDEEYRTDAHPDILGMVHTQGPILISQPDLRHGFLVSDDSNNVALHELAHVIDMADGYADGVPAALSWVATAPWIRVVADRLQKLREGRYGDTLRDYAGTNETELFAVAVEVFFEEPARLAEHDAELYAMLRDYFNQDPARILERARQKDRAMRNDVPDARGAVGGTGNASLA